MHEQARADRRWEHWPEDREVGMRGRLRALFAPTDAGDAVEELIADHGRDLEARAAKLREAVDELERREARTRELHAKIEQILREGSAELDIRQLELDARAQELDRRATALAEAELLVDERRRELGAVELRGAAVARREEAVRGREAELEARERGREPVREDAHVALVTAGSYRLLERDGPAPPLGTEVALDDGTYRCVGVRPSPLPADQRRCAVLECVHPSQTSRNASPKNRPTTPPAARNGP
jgi:hypothetical protein